MFAYFTGGCVSSARGLFQPSTLCSHLDLSLPGRHMDSVVTYVTPTFLELQESFIYAARCSRGFYLCQHILWGCAQMSHPTHAHHPGSVFLVVCEVGPGCRPFLPRQHLPAALGQHMIHLQEETLLL